jgi:hypothetical protein
MSSQPFADARYPEIDPVTRRPQPQTANDAHGDREHWDHSHADHEHGVEWTELIRIAFVALAAAACGSGSGNLFRALA